MGPYCSGVAIPASRVYSEAGVMMSTVGTNPKVTQSGYKNLFRIIASDSQVGSSMAAYAANVLKAKTVGVIDDRTAFRPGSGRRIHQGRQEIRPESGGAGIHYRQGHRLQLILTNLKAKKADVIFFGGYAPQGAPMARQMKQLGIKLKLMGGDTLCSPEMGKLGGDAVGENVLCAQGGTMLDKVASGPAFKDKYKKRYNQNPDVYAASFYDQTMFIGEAMQKAKSVDPVKVGAELYKIRTRALPVPIRMMTRAI